MIPQFEGIATEVDEADEKGSGGAYIVETTQNIWEDLTGIEEGMKYLLVMSSLMSTTLASSPLIETDTTYNEAKEYHYLFNATMHWMVVCRVQITKEAYVFCFKLIFDRCKKDNPEFDIGKTLVGVLIDWSDAEADGLRLAVGANLLLKGCSIHWIQSYQRVAC